ncbi:hypothetical protein [Massilia haematophila]|uniref:Replication protein n=1 Tax=Massilia haematophila TaxID=457923 RepID=A0ABV7PGB5_9BURK
MLSREALRQAAETLPAVTVDSATLLELLDAAERTPKAKAPRAPRQVNDDDEKCARWLYGAILNTAPKFKEPNFKAWANEVRLMRERDGCTHREICELFQWAHTIPFWRGNILSPAKLREHWDRLTIQRDAAAAPKPAATAPWWTSEAAKLAKANEVGVGPARIGESTAAWEMRIREAIDNGGKPPAPQVRIRPTADAANTQEQRGTMPAGLNLKALIRSAPPPRAA